MTHRSRLDRPSGDRDNAVGAARLWLSSMVVLSHSFHFFDRSRDLDPMLRASSGQYTSGGIAVDAFFVLSGFLVARSWTSSRGWGDFLTRRATRIYPGFLAAVLITSLVAAPWLAARGAMDRPQPPTWAGLLLSALVLDYPEMEANASVWVLHYDFYYYLLIAAVGWTGMLAARWPVVAMWAAVGAVYAQRVTCGMEMGPDVLHPRLLTCFLSGAVACAYRDRIPLKWWWFAAAVALLAACASPYPAFRYQGMPLAFPIFGAYALLFACFRPGARAGRAGWLGDYSYGLFLYAYPIQLAVLTVYRDRLDPFTHFLVSWPLAIVAARLSLVLIERPALRLRRRRPPVRLAPPAPHIQASRERARVRQAD